MEKVNQLLDACRDNEVKCVMNNFAYTEEKALQVINAITNAEYYHYNIMLGLNQDYALLHNAVCSPADKWDIKLPTFLQGNKLNIGDYACDHSVVPFTDKCVYRKVSARASKFLISLGQPEQSVIVEYRKHVAEMIASAPIVKWNGLDCHVYEEFIAIPINGKYEYIYLAASSDHAIFVQKKAPKRGNNAWKYVRLSSDIVAREGQTLCYDEEYYRNTNEGKTLFFDIEGFLANLWIAETTRTCEPADEPAYSRTEFNPISSKYHHAPLNHAAAYRYIHITDQTWTKFEHALEHTRDNVNYHVPSWYVRAHYAKRAEKFVLIRAHYAYRKCGHVDNTETTDYIC